MNDFSSEIKYTTARSGGKGGQHVNKVETMVEARWEVRASACFSPAEKERILLKCRNQLSKDGYLIARASETRSQLENKERANAKLLALVEKALLQPKVRKATRIPRSVIEKRRDSKKQQSEKKQARRKDF